MNIYGNHLKLCLSLFFLPIIFVYTTFAQGGYVRGEVSDAYLQEGLPKVEAALLRADSSVVATAMSKWQIIEDKDTHGNTSGMADRHSGAEFRLKAPAEGKYILRLSLKGYETKYANLSVKFNRRTQTFDAGGFAMFPESKKLGEAAVTATRIKMYHKGDTLIYNADAFQTAEGSMLDDLVRQLPGVELRDGRIYAQGKFVESILISGKDFFRGDPNAALQNLPAYVVSKLKFYDKSGEMSETMGRDMHDKSYVMDVNLKRNYQGVWLLNPSVGYGTHDRYEGMLFLMRFDERQNFTFSADFNNIGKVREANDLCTTSDDMPDRRLTNQYVKGTYYIEPNSKFRFSASGGYKHQSYRMENETSSETYLANGNLFTRELSSQKTGLTNVQTDLMAALRPRKGRYFKLDYALSYNKQHLNTLDRAARFTANPDGLVAGSALDSAFSLTVPTALAPLLAYRLQQEQLQNSHDLMQNARAEAQFAMRSNLFKLTIEWKNQHERTEQMQHYDLRYSNATDEAEGADDYRNRFYDLTNDRRTYKAGTEFLRKYIDTDSRSGQFTLSYTYNHQYDSDLNPLYRLDYLQGWGAEANRPLGTLPSVRDSLQQCIDFTNSYDWNARVQHHSLSVNWLHEWQLADSTWMKIQATLPITHSHRSLAYNRSGKSYPVSTRSWLANPSLTLNYMPVRNDRIGYRSLWTFIYNMETEEPSLLYLPILRDDADPLNVSLGNANLKNVQTHRLTLAYKYYNPVKFRSFEARANYTAIHNALTMSSTYNTLTGVRTYQPLNINGNYALGGEMSFSTPIDKQKKVYISNRTTCNFSRSADLNNTESQTVFSRRSEVKNAGAGDELALTFAPNSNLRFTAKASGTWNHIFSQEKSFATLNVYDVRYALTAEAGLPWAIHLSTDVSVSTRYGYSNNAYDCAEYLWNATLSRSWLDEKLGVSLELSDILHSRKRISNELNAWGRIEHYTRLYTPAYVMLHISYRFMFSKN